MSLAACWWCSDPLDCPFCNSCHHCDGLCADAAAVERRDGDPDAGRWLS